MKKIKEGKAVILARDASKVSKEMPVFYNPVMEFNRTVSVLLIGALGRKKLKIGLPLAGTGVRAVRFVRELSKGAIEEIHVNDNSSKAVGLIKKNLKLNKAKAQVFNKPADSFLLESTGYDYIDIDPFGSPNPFLDAAAKRIARQGILAVTATDTGCLCGSYANACKRKYWAVPQRNETMHENGLRILIRKVQLIGAQYDKALRPLYSYSKDHYFRVFFQCEKGKKAVDNVLSEHGMLGNAGPLWLGSLWDKNIAKKLAKQSPFLKVIYDESRVGKAGFFEIHSITKRQKMKFVPTTEEIMKRIRKEGYKVSRTHFSATGIRTDIPENMLYSIMRKI